MRVGWEKTFQGRPGQNGVDQKNRLLSFLYKCINTTNCISKTNTARGEYRPFLRSVTAFGLTKIGTQIFDRSTKDIILILFNSC